MIDLVEKHFLHRGHGVEFEMEVDWIRRALPDGQGPVLDVGCGIGALFAAIGGRRVIGLDINPAGLAHTRQRHPSARLLRADAIRLPLKASTLDAIVVQHVIEHIAAYKEALREWRRILKPGGRLILLTPNAAFRDPIVYEDESHVHIFNRHDLDVVLRDSGYSVVDLRTLGLPWFRRYHAIRGGWRLRRWVTQWANSLSQYPTWRWQGQTLCCAAEPTP